MARISLIIPLIILIIFLILASMLYAVQTNTGSHLSITIQSLGGLLLLIYLVSPLFFITGTLLALFSIYREGKFNVIALIGFSLNVVLLTLIATWGVPKY